MGKRMCVAVAALALAAVVGCRCPWCRRPAAPVAFTHVVQAETVFYRVGPQQAFPPDGTLAAGTKVTLLRDAGSYSQVRTAEGRDVYVATASLKPIQ